MSLRLNFYRSVPPEFLRSFFGHSLLLNSFNWQESATCHQQVELQNIKSFSQSKSFQPNLPPKMCKSRQFSHMNWINQTRKITSGEWSSNVIMLHSLPRRFHPQPANFLHGCILKIRDILQLCQQGAWVALICCCHGCLRKLDVCLMKSLTIQGNQIQAISYHHDLYVPSTILMVIYCATICSAFNTVVDTTSVGFCFRVLVKAES